MKKTVAFYTLGCKVNQYETEAIMQKFKSCGYEIKDFDEKADVYVINTCSVTAVADRKSRTQIRKARKTNKNAVVAVCGCYAQTHEKELRSIPEIDIVIGTAGKDKLVMLVEKKGEEKIFAVDDIMLQKTFEETFVSCHTDKTRAFMKIQDGCDNYCAYCIIPYARGHIRSRSMENIRAEAEKFVSGGYKEIVLTGIHLTSYGKETGENSIFDVIKMLHEINGLERIRLGSLEMNGRLTELAEHSAELPKLCNHFHVSLQSGCNETLRRMGRKYTAEEFYNAVYLLKKAFPGAAITTDIMVGFPGETLEEFMQSRDFAEKAEFAKMHIFPYSARQGTRAAKMEGQIDNSVKKDRAALMEQVNSKSINGFARKQLGKTVSVLFEQPEDGFFTGHTTNYLKIYVKTEENLHNTIKEVKITEYTSGKLYGELSDVKTP